MNDNGHIAIAMVLGTLLILGATIVVGYLITRDVPSAVPDIWAYQENYTPAQNLTITFIDVGQGDAVFVQTAGKAMLVDTGPDKYCDHVIDVLRGVPRLDFLVITHQHADHDGCLDEVTKNYGVVSSIDNTNINTAYGVYLGDGIKGRILNPQPSKRFSDENDNSVVLLITYHNSTLLLTGDSEMASEDYYRDKLPHVDVLKVAHHGSDSSTSAKLLAKTTPDYCIISVGEGNQYGHPGQTTLDWMGYYGCEIHRTDKEGDITMTTDGETWTTL